jgi:hypothetical protein
MPESRNIALGHEPLAAPAGVRKQMEGQQREKFVRLLEPGARF